MPGLIDIKSDEEEDRILTLEPIVNNQPNNEYEYLLDDNTILQKPGTPIILTDQPKSVNQNFCIIS
jgi:hypothetical protein